MNRTAGISRLVSCKYCTAEISTAQIEEIAREIAGDSEKISVKDC